MEKKSNPVINIADAKKAIEAKQGFQREKEEFLSASEIRLENIAKKIDELVSMTDQLQNKVNMAPVSSLAIEITEGMEIINILKKMTTLFIELVKMLDKIKEIDSLKLFNSEKIGFERGMTVIDSILAEIERLHKIKP